MHGDYSSTVWPARTVAPTPMTEAAAGPWSDIWVELRNMGWTDAQINTWVTVMFNHYIRDLGYTAPATWAVLSSLVLTWKNHIAAGVVIGWFWAGVALGAALILYALLLPEYIADIFHRFGPREYFMLYEDRVWFAEVIGVSPRQKGTYQKGSEIPVSMMAHLRNIEGMDWNSDEFYYCYSYEEKKWELGRFRRVRWNYIACTYVGNMVRVGVNHYDIIRPQVDRFLSPTGPWTSPGGAWGTPGYTGVLYPGYFA